MAPSLPLLALRDEPMAASSNTTTASVSQQSSSSDDSTRTWVLVAIIVGLVTLIAISVFVILRMLRLRERRRIQRQHQQYGQNDDQNGCETGHLSPYLHAARPQQQRKLSKLSDADRRSWGEHVEQEQRAMMIRKSLASRSAEFPGRRHSDSVSSSASSVAESTFPTVAVTPAERPTSSSERIPAEAAHHNSDVGFEQEKDDEEQQFPAGGLRDDWKAFEAQLHLDKSLSRETHPAAAGRGT